MTCPGCKISKICRFCNADGGKCGKCEFLEERQTKKQIKEEKHRAREGAEKLPEVQDFVLIQYADKAIKMTNEDYKVHSFLFDILSSFFIPLISSILIYLDVIIRRRKGKVSKSWVWAG